MVIRVLPFDGRTAPRFPCEKSYSAFIVLHLSARRTASRNQPDIVAAKRVSNDQELPGATSSNRYEPLFAFGIRILLVYAQGIEEYAFGVGKRHAMLLEIGRGLCPVKFEAHH